MCIYDLHISEDLINQMKTARRSLLAAFCVAAASFSFNSTVQAQATRTWVSGTGDDNSAGSRTAPCKTFAGAISKTAAGGEINILDPGGFGIVTITKSITIDGIGAMAGISSSGTTGIVIAAGASDVVTVRNLVINGTGTGTYGIRVTSGGVVRIENCWISGGTTNGINFAPSTTNGVLYVKNCHIFNCGGIAVSSKPSVSGKVIIEDSSIEQCSGGIFADTNSTVVINRSSVLLHTNAGVETAAGAVASIVDTYIDSNGMGISSAGSVTVSGSSIVGNVGAGLSTSAGGTIKTFHNNIISGNSPDGNPTGSLPLR